MFWGKRDVLRSLSGGQLMFSLLRSLSGNGVTRFSTKDPDLADLLDNSSLVLLTES